METIWTLFQESARRHATRPAVVAGADRLTYGELERRVRARAAELTGAGLGPGERVALLDRNSLPFLEAYLAAAGLGAVLQPLNHRLAPLELDAILADAGARLLVASRELADLVAALGAPPPVRWAEAPPETDPAGFRPAEVRPADPAHLYYTSGTTGRPKGVVLTHDNVCAHARAAVEELGLTRDDRWGHFAPMFHLADAWACFALTAAGGLHVIERRFEAEQVLGTIEAERVTLTNLVPTMLADLVSSPRAETVDLASLRLVLSGGAPIAPALVRRIVETLGCAYAQTYGMTETSPYLTLSLPAPGTGELPPDEELRRRCRTGRPFAGVELEVVDAHGRAVPADDRTVGEIRVRGRSVSPGYWRRPEETAAVFRDGWLYTGDLAVIDAASFIDIVDRKKDVILTGGETVYSTEVEKALLEHPAVREAAVFAVPDARWGEAVHAAVVLRPGASAEPEELRAACRERIAGYKVPRTIELRAALPRTGSGKVAKRRLRAESE